MEFLIIKIYIDKYRWICTNINIKLNYIYKLLKIFNILNNYLKI